LFLFFIFSFFQRSLYKSQNVLSLEGSFIPQLVGPKRQALAEAETSLKAAMDALATKKAELDAVLKKVKQLEDDFESSRRKQEDLKKQGRKKTQLFSRSQKSLNFDNMVALPLYQNYV
jgi:predicted  nucleic acid-binding Zn-ribbon protein